MLKSVPHFTPTENILAGGQKRRDIRPLQIHVSGQVSEFLSRNVTHKKLKKKFKIKEF
jgi:hypothetical protein